MNANHKKFGVGLLVAALLFALSWQQDSVVAKKPPKPPPEEPPVPVQYEEQYLPTEEGWYSTAYDVNDEEIIVGRQAYPSRAVVWQPNGQGSGWVREDLTDRLIDEGAGITLSIARCINNDGLIAGNSTGGVFACNLNGPDPVLWTSAFPGGNASDVSDSGIIVGSYQEQATDTRRLFLWDPANDVRVIVELFDESGNELTPAGSCSINPLGTQVVGTLAGQNNTPIFRFDIPSALPASGEIPITPEILAEDSGDSFYISGRIDVSDDGTVAGSIPHKNRVRPARRLPGMDWELLTTNRKQYGESAAINRLGHICGVEWGGKQGFVFFNGDNPSFWVLDDLLRNSPMPAPWLREPRGMSNSVIDGFPVIVGDRWETGEGPQTAVVLIPVPETP